jgi:HK97 family phage prohead protease
MLIQDFPLKVKELSEEGSFEGYAAVYGDRDLVDDVIMPGAFSAAIQHQGRGFPLLWSHKSDQPVGLARIADDRAGLLCHGQLLMTDPNAQRAYEHLKAGVVRGLSIGFTLPKGDGKVTYRDDGARVLKEIRLHEISLTAIPAAPRAQITNVKDIHHTLRLMERLNADDIDELIKIDKELRRLLKGNDPREAKKEVVATLTAFAQELQQLRV